MSLLISAQQLNHSFSGKNLFTDLSFGLFAGQRVALLGPNGAGKSTLMKILAGQLSADSGQIVGRKGLRISYLGQTPTFPKEATLLSFLLDNYMLEPELIARTLEWMGKIGLQEFAEDTLIQSLSGGWQKKVALVHALARNPDLLLLDEPTNHLDVTSIRWLEDVLREASFTTLVITHDRVFMQRVCTRILDLDPRWPGNMLDVAEGYAHYLETKASVLSHQKVREQKLSNLLRREKEWMARGAQARQTKQKFRMDEGHRLGAEVEDLKKTNRSRDLMLDFESTQQGPKKLIETAGLGKKLGDRWLFRNLDLVIRQKSRIALVGNNGCGKTSLIRALIGEDKNVEGRVRSVERLKTVYFEQGRETLKPQLSVLKNLCPEGDYVKKRDQYIHVRSYLDQFHFSPQQADLPVERLSGGEQARLRLAQLMLQDCQLLVMDEPTNDLDLETLLTLEQTLQEFDGALILVSHDRAFVDQVSEQLLVFSPFPGESELLTFADSLQWEAWYDQKLNSAISAKPVPKNDSKPSANKKKLSQKEQKELSEVETLIHVDEEQLEQLSSSMTGSHNPEELKKLTEQMHRLQQQIEARYARWAELEKKSSS